VLGYALRSVVGAGIGGLAAALALRSRDIDAVVLEQAGRLDPMGAGIQLSPNANQVLARLGVLDAVADAAFEPRTLAVLAGRRGRTVLSAPMHAWAHDRYERPYLNVHRGDLHAVLLDAVCEVLPGSVLAQTADPVAALARYSQVFVDRVSRIHSRALRNAKTFHSTA
jgi:flavin-dependent dehydrogenase